MTPKELKRLSRTDLLEMVLELTKENDQLYKDTALLRHQLDDRILTIEKCGTLAEAALQLNGVFEAAQQACDQYTENIRYRSENIEDFAQQLEQEARERREAARSHTKQQKKKAQEDLRDLFSGSQFLANPKLTLSVWACLCKNYCQLKEQEARQKCEEMLKQAKQHTQACMRAAAQCTPEKKSHGKFEADRTGKRR